LRNREAKYSGLRREIARILSFQIGEGRALSTFEIQAVIDSRIRENKLKEHSVTVNEIIEDLVSETISSPLLHSDRKADIVENLRRVYSKGQILLAIDRYDISYRGFLVGIQGTTELVREDYDLVRTEASIAKEDEPEREREAVGLTVSSMFGLLAGIATTIAASLSLLSFLKSDDIRTFLTGRSFLINIFLGMAASLIAAAATYLVKRGVDRSISGQIHKGKAGMIK